MNRRSFLVRASSLSGGLALTLVFPSLAKCATADKGTQGRETELAPWLKIDINGKVTVRVTHTEIGNGATTQTAMNIAEELGCDWRDITTEQASVTRDYLSGGEDYSIGFQPWFGGHSTNSQRMQYALQVGASTRERLKLAAAHRWQTDVDSVEVKDGQLIHAESNRELSFGQVAEAAASITLEQEPTPKKSAEWTLIGKKSLTKLHVPAVTNGRAVYGIDVNIPGMLYAAIKQCPVHGGILKGVNAKKALQMPGVRKVVTLDKSKTVGTPVKDQSTFGLRMTETASGVAVIAEHYWQAKKALDAIQIEWELGLGERWQSVEQVYDEAKTKLTNDDGRIIKNVGTISNLTPNVSVSAEYRTPFCEHMAMEPINGTAVYHEDKLEIWCPTQDVKQAYWIAIDESGHQPENVIINPTLVGGGFGRRTSSAEIRSVVSVAREMPGVPIKLIMSREESTQQGRYRIMANSQLKADLNADGIPINFSGGVCFSGGNMISFPFGFSDAPYIASGKIPNIHLTQHALPIHLNTGAYRAPCYNANVFFIETFIDECAAAAKADPLKYRLQLIDNKWDPSWHRCLKLAAEKIGWGRTLPKNEGLGIAIANWPMSGIPNKGTTLATAVHVVVSPEGRLILKRVDVAFDCGSTANRDAVAAQIEGSIIFGINMALNEEITLDHGAVVETNFHQYPMVKLSDCPEINVHFEALSNQPRFDIIGEVGVGPIGPAIGNAIYNATKKRLRSTPFRKHDLSRS